MRAPKLSPSLDKSAAIRLATAGAVARRELDRACRAAGRPLREVLVLMLLSDGDLTPAAVADRLGLDRSEVSRVARGLFEEGWLELELSRYDGRSRVLSATPGAARIGPAATYALAGVDRRLLMHLSPLRRKQLGTCLELLKGPRSPVADALAGL